MSVAAKDDALFALLTTAMTVLANEHKVIFVLAKEHKVIFVLAKEHKVCFVRFYCQIVVNVYSSSEHTSKMYLFPVLSLK